ncbi:MAG: metallophosphoesterase [Cyclobacteriaceae bacterium]|nr:metallophosphoesterase [Cyclobacteriaceae bacterium]
MSRFWLGACMLVAACQGKYATQLPYTTLWQQGTATVNHGSDKADTVFTSGWKFTRGLREGVHANRLLQPDSVVELPHRVVLPNTDLWYLKTISFAQAGVLRVRADDGAQLWVNGKPAQRLNGDSFKVEASSEATILIRVLNNAMAGGLLEVSYYTHSHAVQQEQAHQRSLQRNKLEQKRILLGDTTLPLLIGPWLTQSDSVYKIRLVADAGVTLYWGATPSVKNAQTARAGFVQFEVPAPASAWYYKVCSGTVCSPTYRVAGTQTNFQFTVWGDSQSGWKQFATHLQNLQASTDAFTIGVGDLVGNGSNEAAWQTLGGLFSTYAAERPAYLVAGNHDYDGYYTDLQPRLYQQYAAPSAKPWFAWRYSNCAFIAIDPNAQFPIGFAGEQQQWLQAQLKSPLWQQAEWRFIVLHQPPFSQGWPGYQGDAVVRELLEPLLETARIDFVIAGHTHDYERLVKVNGRQQTNFIITGGGGGSLEPDQSSPTPRMDTVIKTHNYLRFKIASNKLEWTAYDLNNRIIDYQKREK